MNNQKVSLSHEYTPLNEVIAELNKKSEKIKFALSPELATDPPQVTLELKEANLNKVLLNLWTAAEVRFKITNGTVTFFPHRHPQSHFASRTWAVPPRYRHRCT